MSSSIFKIKRLKDESLNLYAIKKRGRTVAQIEDRGNQLIIYPVCRSIFFVHKGKLKPLTEVLEKKKIAREGYKPPPEMSERPDKPTPPPPPKIEQIFREKVLKVVNDAIKVGELKISIHVLEE